MDQNLTMTITRIVIVLIVIAVVGGISWTLLRKRQGDDEFDLHPRRRGSALDKGNPLPPSELQEFDANGVELIQRDEENTPQKTSRLSPTFFAGKKEAKNTAPKEAPPTMNLPLTIMARHGKSFSGRDVEKLVRTFGLKRSPNHTFELIAGNGRDVFFTLLNIHKPGFFPAKLEELDAIEGVMMIMQLPVGNDAQKSLETFLAMASEMSESVNGRLCDYARVPMSDKDMLNYRKAAEQFDEEFQAWRARQR